MTADALTPNDPSKWDGRERRIAQKAVEQERRKNMRELDQEDIEDLHDMLGRYRDGKAIFKAIMIFGGAAAAIAAFVAAVITIYTACKGAWR